MAPAGPTAAPTPVPFRLRLLLILTLATLLAGTYLVRFVGPYLSYDPTYYDYFWPRRFVLLPHLAGGLVAILTSPVQLCLGATDGVSACTALWARSIFGRSRLAVSAATLSPGWTFSTTGCSRQACSAWRWPERSPPDWATSPSGGG